MGAYLSSPVLEKESESGGSRRLRFGVSQMQGWRRTMEDAHLAVPVLEGDETAALFGVFDGHGGREVALFVARHLVGELVAQGRYRDQGEEALRWVFHRMDELLRLDEHEAEIRALRATGGAGGTNNHHKQQPNSSSSGTLGGDDDDDDDDDDGQPPAPLAPANSLSVVEGGQGQGGGPGLMTHAEALHMLQQLLVITGQQQQPLPPAPGSAEEEEDEEEDDGDEEGALVMGGEGGELPLLISAPPPPPPMTMMPPPAPSSSSSGDDDDPCSPSSLASPHSPLLLFSPQPTVGGAGGGGGGESGAGMGPRRPEDLPLLVGSDDDEEGLEEGDPSLAAVTEVEEDGDSEDDDDDDNQGGRQQQQQHQHQQVMLARAKSRAAARAALNMPLRLGGGGPNRFCSLPDHRVQAGCTAVLALLVGERLLVANAGDSRAVLCRGGQALGLSEDHKPQQERERERIRKAGGFVTEQGRVNGNLNLSRSIGDLKYKGNPSLGPEEQMITAEPDVMAVTITPQDEFLLLACDGVWDCKTNQQAVDFVRSRLLEAAQEGPEREEAGGELLLRRIAEELLDECVAEDPRKSGGIGGDNMTCLIVHLNQPDTTTTTTTTTTTPQPDPPAAAAGQQQPDGGGAPY